MKLKRHQFFVEFLPKTCLLGLSISQHETKIAEDDSEWHPAFSIELGLAFIKFSYINISIS